MSVAWLEPVLAVDAIIGLVLVELAVLCAWRRPWFAACAATLLSGLALLVALRLALAAAGTGWILSSLLLAGVAHAVDLRRRTAGR